MQWYWYDFRALYPWSTAGSAHRADCKTFRRSGWTPSSFADHPGMVPIPASLVQVLPSTSVCQVCVGRT